MDSRQALRASVHNWTATTSVELAEYLRGQGIPVEAWGRDTARTVEHLHRELTRGEAYLAEESGRLIRTALWACLDIVYPHPQGDQLLREDRQVYRDGREYRRELLFSIGEKLYLNESYIEAAYRALREELGINERLDLGANVQTVREAPSTSYPGLYSRFIICTYPLTLPKRHYRARGYIEVQADKTSFFQWIPINS